MARAVSPLRMEEVAIRPRRWEGDVGEGAMRMRLVFMYSGVQRVRAALQRSERVRSVEWSLVCSVVVGVVVREVVVVEGVRVVLERVVRGGEVEE